MLYLKIRFPLSLNHMGIIEITVCKWQIKFPSKDYLKCSNYILKYNITTVEASEKLQPPGTMDIVSFSRKWRWLTNYLHFHWQCWQIIKLQFLSKWKNWSVSSFKSIRVVFIEIWAVKSSSENKIAIQFPINCRVSRKIPAVGR